MLFRSRPGPPCGVPEDLRQNHHLRGEAGENRGGHRGRVRQLYLDSIQKQLLDIMPE